MKKILFIFIFFLFFLTNLNAQYGWTNVLNLSNYFLHRSFFLNENIGFVVGEYYSGSYWLISKTTNGGINWSQQSGNIGTTVSLRSVFFTDSQKGYAVGGDYGSSAFFRTTNQGVNWALINIGYPNNYFYDINFLNSNTGVITGSGIILRTSNGGSNWLQIDGVPNVFIAKIDFSKSESGLCYAVGRNSCIMRSTNSGLSWDILNLNTTNDTVFNSISIVNDSICYVSGAISNFPYNFVWRKTTNGGNSWLNLPINLPSYCRFDGRICFFSDTCGVLASNGIFKTTNGGINWKNQEAPTTGTLYYDLYFLNQNFGVALATQQSIYNGLIYRTTTGGNGPPVAPSGLYCTRKYGVNRLSWSDNSLSELGFKIQRCNISDTLWLELTSIPANTTSYNDSNSTANVKYRTYAFNEFGNSLFSNTAVPVILNVEKQTNKVFNIFKNYPNPFNISSTIKYQIIKSGNVKINIYNILGKEIATLVNEKLQAGTYEVKFEGTNLPSGVYYYKIICGDFSEVRKMVLIK